jgi:hypothetical protein
MNVSPFPVSPQEENLLRFKYYGLRLFGQFLARLGNRRFIAQSYHGKPRISTTKTAWRHTGKTHARKGLKQENAKNICPST